MKKTSKAKVKKRVSSHTDATPVLRESEYWMAARTLAESKRFDAIITLGVLLRGETAHYEAIYTEVARGIGQSCLRPDTRTRWHLHSDGR